MSKLDHPVVVETPAPADQRSILAQRRGPAFRSRRAQGQAGLHRSRAGRDAGRRGLVRRDDAAALGGRRLRQRRRRRLGHHRRPLGRRRVARRGRRLGRDRRGHGRARSRRRSASRSTRATRSSTSTTRAERASTTASSRCTAAAASSRSTSRRRAASRRSRLILGPCAGAAAYSPALTDWTIMVKEQGQMFLTGPDIVKAATGEDATAEDIGGSALHTKVSGVAHLEVDSEEEAFDDDPPAAVVPAHAQGRQAEAPRLRARPTRTRWPRCRRSCRRSPASCST